MMIIITCNVCTITVQYRVLFKIRAEDIMHKTSRTTEEPNCILLDCLTDWLTDCLSVYLSIYLSIYLYIYLSIYLSMYLSIYLCVRRRSIGLAMPQSASPQLPTAHSRINPSAAHVGFVVDTVTLGQVFPFFPADIIPPWLPAHSFTYCSFPIESS